MRPNFLMVIGVLVLAGTPARAVDKEDIAAAVERGVIALKRMQADNGRWRHEYIGATALAGLALLECGEDASDRHVQRAAEAIRKEGLGLTHTYSLALCVLFLDRLDHAADTPLIESMLVRLLAGQNGSGGWTYDCPSISAAEQRRLEAEMQGRELRGGRDLSKLPKKGSRTEADLPKEIQGQLRVAAVAGGLPGADDNSNTQFATLALWVGRRYGVPTHVALRRVERRFRASQNGDGGWGYTPRSAAIGALAPMRGMPGLGSTATMTCAGLLGVLCGQGTRGDEARAKGKAKGKAKADKAAPVDVGKDAVVRSALQAIATAIGNPVGGEKVERGRRRDPAARAAGRAYYFLWSLERVAVILGLETIGKKDWYGWGAEVLLANQGPDGTWQGMYGDGGVDTCFALLFLKKSNLARDLSSSLTGVKDVRVLKAGIGASGLKGVGSKGLAPTDIGEKTTDPSEASSGRRPAAGKPKESTRPRSVAEETAARLARDLVRTRGETRAGMLKALRDSKGPAYTEALAGVIPKLEGETLKQARQALADRLTRMKVETLREYFKERDTEIRRAAALAAGQKDARTLVPDLIGLLEDEETMVQRAAHASLKAIAGTDLGPKAGAEAEERKKAITAWQAWWKKQTRE
jgi:hypothetical protein